MRRPIGARSFPIDARRWRAVAPSRYQRGTLAPRIGEPGAVLVREDGRDSVYETHSTKGTIAVPRHAEVKRAHRKKASSVSWANDQSSLTGAHDRVPRARDRRFPARHRVH